jgi:preprotein translocase subunit SecE
VPQNKDEEKKKGHRIVHYFKEVRAEISKVVWPTRQVTVRLTLIVLGVTAAMSIALGVLDWVFTKVFELIVT